VPPSSTTPAVGPCGLIPNVEILDRITGKTEVILGAAHPLPASGATPRGELSSLLVW